MHKLMIVASLFVVACASSAQTAAHRSYVGFDRSLPSVDRLGKPTALGMDPKVDLRLCTDADGRVASVDIEHSSETREFDRAVMHDVAAWEFTPTAAPECHIVTVRYQPQA
jgi:TonB family protein